MNCALGEPVSSGSSSQTRRIMLPPHGDFYLKRYHYSEGRLRIRPDKAQREVRNYSYLRQVCGIPVPDVVCFGARSGVWARRDGFVMTRRIPESLSLEALASQKRARPHDEADRAARRQLLNEACTIVRRMHAQHFYHLDLQWRNILVQDMRRLYLIDSWRGGPRWGPVFQAHGRLRDLSSLAKEAVIRMTLSERVRWLRTYFQTRRLTREQRMIIRAIERDRLLKDNSTR